MDISSFSPEDMPYPERRFPPLEGMDPAILTWPLAIGATGKATEPGISDAISVRQKREREREKPLIHRPQVDNGSDKIREKLFQKQAGKSFPFFLL